MKILLIEDSKFQRVANERALVKAGHSVIQAGDGEEGLRVACKDIPDLILLDMMLPKVSAAQPAEDQNPQRGRPGMPGIPIPQPNPQQPQ